jgi:hypothetical protein
MSAPEQGNQDGGTPEQLMADAETGFGLSHAFVPENADHLRLGAAAMFGEGAGTLLYEKLIALGLTDDLIDKLTEQGMLEETLQRLAPDAMREIRQRLQRIVASDPDARNALETEAYFTDREQGRTQND